MFWPPVPAEREPNVSHSWHFGGWAMAMRSWRPTRSTCCIEGCWWTTTAWTCRPHTAWYSFSTERPGQLSGGGRVTLRPSPCRREGSWPGKAMLNGSPTALSKGDHARGPVCGVARSGRKAWAAVALRMDRNAAERRRFRCFRGQHRVEMSAAGLFSLVFWALGFLESRTEALCG